MKRTYRSIEHAISHDEILKTKKIELKETEALINISGGDARKLLNLLELVTDALGNKAMITDETVMQIAQQRIESLPPCGLRLHGGRNLLRGRS